MSTIPTRDQIKKEDTWDLEILFSSREEWEKARQSILDTIPKIAAYEGSITENAEQILQILQEIWAIALEAEKVSGYAHLHYSEDSSNTENQELLGLDSVLSSKFYQAISFLDTELSELSTEFLEQIASDPRFKDYAHQLRQLIRDKAHILSKQEELLLAKQSEYANGFYKAFAALTDIDMKFGSIDTPEGPQELSHAVIGVLMEHKDRDVRKQAYEQYYGVFTDHVHTLSNLYMLRIQEDNAMANIRKHPSALEKKLYKDNIPLSLYTGLIEQTRKFLPVLHKHYQLLQQQSQLDNFAVYDLRVCPFTTPDHNKSYDEAVELLNEALQVLDLDTHEEKYSEILTHGLTEARWVDKYENKGKRSGAFSSSIYGALPYILMNYQSKSLNHIFTLAHEAGHSMHSYYSNKHNAFSQAHYTIFEAEVASTVNEFLLYRYLIDRTEDKALKQYLLWHEIQDFISVFFRQTMFAEFEKITHEYSAEGNPLTSQFFLQSYENLSNDYYGKEVLIPEINHITGLRIPHFYSSFYVYKYATGIASAVDIASRIYSKQEGALEGYFEFLKSGGSRFPLDSLRLAGVDYSTHSPITRALEVFEKNCQELEALTIS